MEKIIRIRKLLNKAMEELPIEATDAENRAKLIWSNDVRANKILFDSINEAERLIYEMTPDISRTCTGPVGKVLDGLCYTRKLLLHFFSCVDNDVVHVNKVNTNQKRAILV